MPINIPPDSLHFVHVFKYVRVCVGESTGGSGQLWSLVKQHDTEQECVGSKVAGSESPIS